MAEKKTTRKTTKKVVETPTKVVVEAQHETLVPHQTYTFIANGKGGMQKDHQYKVSGVVANTLIKQGFGKIVD